ncbi:hypothetical protein os1_18350 [Comamonadaceae bacterium OS-1]|nr:hypothetical protein os1_18350 [Comamonadaceae bacterium OS-1]
MNHIYHENIKYLAYSASSDGPEKPQDKAKT